MFNPTNMNCSPNPGKIPGATVIVICDPAMTGFIRMLRDAAHLYAVAGNADGLACCRAHGRLLCQNLGAMNATPEMRLNLQELMSFDIEFTQARLKQVAEN